ncbi:MAG: phenylalanine--tRNA ligase subunit beta [Candidatus Micrarchaeia archaeon]
MPNVTFELKYLMSLISPSIEKDKLQEIVYNLGLEVEHINDKEITLEVTSNRPDLFSIYGLARAIRNYLHINKKFNYELIKENEKPYLSIIVSQEMKKAKQFISGFVANGITFNDQLLSEVFNFSEKFSDTIGRKRRKAAIGIHDLDKIKGDVKFEFSKDENFSYLNSKNEEKFSYVLKNTEKGREYTQAIPKNNDGRYPVLKDEEGFIAFVPILNSNRTAVTKNTKNVFVEITGSSQDMVERANNLLAITFSEFSDSIKPISIKGNNKIQKMPELVQKYISIPMSQIEYEIGVSIGFNNIISLANKMGYDAALLGRNIRFSIPEYRLDILNEQDIIEDIAIAYGYDYINNIPVPSISKGKFLLHHYLFENISNTLVGMGFSESMSTYLTNESKNFSDMCIKIPDADSYIRLKDSKSTSLSMARTWLLPSLLNVISSSKHEKFPQKVFELDLVFNLNNKKPSESYHIAGVSSGNKQNFNDIKSVVESLLTINNLVFTIEEDSRPTFIEGRCASIIINGVKKGFMGEISPKVLQNFGIDEPTIAFEINLSN